MTHTQSQSQKKLAVVVASGGLDSCVTAAVAAQNYRLAFFHAQYGQRTARRELQAFHDLAAAFNTEETLVVPMTHFSIMGGSSLTSDQLDVPTTGVEDGVVPVTYVPFRNANLFAAAVSWAEVIGACAVFVGINQRDSSGYPDCTEQFLDTFNTVVKHGTRPETHIKVIAPLMQMTKADIVRTAMKLGAPVEKSWSCYQNSDKACGVCDSCRLRLEGFETAGFRDPIPYVRR